MRFQRVLVLAPHTDDAELGCGGFMARLVEEKTSVFVAAFSTARESVPEGSPHDTILREFYRAMAILEVPPDRLFVCDYPVRRFSDHRQDILEDLRKLRRTIEPDLILLPSGQDVHQDHQVLHNEGVRAFKDLTVFGYELPWNHLSFRTQAFVDLKPGHVQKKWQALQAYRSQIELKRPYFSEDFIQGLARLRGTQIKTDWAEAFEVVRVIL
ncbi:PIG-L deacetylase family protein [Brevibacillus sp. B_LB10_24]|uniref:PIG-L deacetylase family protein n=1 Tax=Brevibacillus sp. B_LB10_24 TaxID=3380645 RepID=UPI0038BB1072